VTDTSAALLPGASVRYQRVVSYIPGPYGKPVPAPGETLISSAVSADATGSFTATNLPAGTYLLCASVPSAPYLDPCQWASAIPVSVSAAAVAKQNIALTKGVFLNVQINDPQGLLAQSVPSLMSAGGLVVGVRFGNGAFLGAPSTSVGSTARSYQMPVPAGVPLGLWLFSHQVVLTDSGGKAVSTPGALIPFQAATGQDQSFTFTVSGPAAAAAAKAQ
jgi:hypothetical protein